MSTKMVAMTEWDGQNRVLNKKSDHDPFFLFCVVCIKHSIMTIPKKRQFPFIEVLFCYILTVMA